MPAEIARTSLVLLAFIAIFGVISQILSHRSLKKKKKYFEQLHKDLTQTW